MELSRLIFAGMIVGHLNHKDWPNLQHNSYLLFLLLGSLKLWRYNVPHRLTNPKDYTHVQ